MTKADYLKQWLQKANKDLPAHDLGDLTAYAVQSRYPDETYEPTADETRRYIALAEDVVSTITETVLGSHHSE